MSPLELLTALVLAAALRRTEGFVRDRCVVIGSHMEVLVRVLRVRVEQRQACDEDAREAVRESLPEETIIAEMNKLLDDILGSSSTGPRNGLEIVALPYPAVILGRTPASEILTAVRSWDNLIADHVRPAEDRLVGHLRFLKGEVQGDVSDEDARQVVESSLPDQDTLVQLRQLKDALDGDLPGCVFIVGATPSIVGSFGETTASLE